MKRHSSTTSAVLLGGLCLLSLAATGAQAGQSDASRHVLRSSVRRLSGLSSWRKRQDSGEEQDTIATQGETDPFGAAVLADDQPYIKGNYSGSDNSPYSLTPDTGDFQQLPWNTNVYFQQSAATNGSETGGWQELPDTPGFILNRSVAIPNSKKTGSGIMPFYITENTLTPETVIRAIMMWPGKPRDAWNYANLMMNARSVVAENFAQWGVSNDSVLILAPVFMAAADMTAGGGHAGEISFGGEMWQSGSSSHTPTLNDSITSYEIMDFFADMLFNKTFYPNLNQVVVVGHSLGGQASMRYALLKRTKYYDNNMRFWVGNPGSWTWLSDARPYPNANMSCLAGTNTSYEDWPYGIGGNTSQVTKYARANVVANASYIVTRFLGRSIHYALGLLDNGPGDTRCQAQWQGANHLDRGSNFILAYENLTLGDNKFPSAHTVDFVANTSHQDFPMYSANISLQRIFYDGFSTRNPDITNTTDPGDPTKTSNTTLETARPYATPIHEKVAVALLLGPLGLLLIVFTLLPFAFSENFEDTYENDVKSSGPGSAHYPQDTTVSSMTHLLHNKR